MNTGSRVQLRNGAVGSVEHMTSGPRLWFRPQDETAEREAITEEDVEVVLDEPDVDLIEVLPRHSENAHRPPIGTEPSDWALKSVVDPPEETAKRRLAASAREVMRGT